MLSIYEALPKKQGIFMSVVELEQTEAITYHPQLASVYMLESDISLLGGVRQETLEQVYDEELTFIVEALDRPHKTSFIIDYSESANDFFNKRGDSLSHSYQKGYEAAKKTAIDRPIYKFHEFRCSQDVKELEDLKALMKEGEVGEAVVVLSPFPEEAYRSFGKENLEAIGYRPDRQMGFIRINRKVSDSQVEVTSISMDNSDLTAFKAVAEGMGVDVPLITSSDMYLKYRARTQLTDEEITNTYDNFMSRKYGGNFAAGRRKIGEENAWDFITSQKNACEYYFSELQILASRHDLLIEERAELKEALTAGFWARLSEAESNPIAENASLSTEFHGALERAESRYETMVGCGGAIALAPKSLLENSKSDIFSFIFSNSNHEKQWVWTKGLCRVSGCPSRPKRTVIGPCSVCVGCQHLFDKNKDPAREYKKIRTQKRWKNKPKNSNQQPRRLF